jgi:hypothetical protein
MLFSFIVREVVLKNYEHCFNFTRLILVKSSNLATRAYINSSSTMSVYYIVLSTLARH